MSGRSWNSENPSLTIPSTRSIRHNGSVYTIYEMKVIDGPETFTLEKRFNAFAELHSLLRRAYGDELMPQFPKSSFFENKYDPDVIARRQQDLQLYMNILLLDRRILHSPLLKSFLQPLPKNVYASNSSEAGIHREAPVPAAAPVYHQQSIFQPQSHYQPQQIYLPQQHPPLPQQVYFQGNKGHQGVAVYQVPAPARAPPSSGLFRLPDPGGIIIPSIIDYGVSDTCLLKLVLNEAHESLNYLSYLYDQLQLLEHKENPVAEKIQLIEQNLPKLISSSALLSQTIQTIENILVGPVRSITSASDGLLALLTACLEPLTMGLTFAQQISDLDAIFATLSENDSLADGVAASLSDANTNSNNNNDDDDHNSNSERSSHLVNNENGNNEHDEIIDYDVVHLQSESELNNNVDKVADHFAQIQISDPLLLDNYLVPIDESNQEQKEEQQNDDAIDYKLEKEEDDEIMPLLVPQHLVPEHERKLDDEQNRVVQDSLVAEQIRQQTKRLRAEVDSIINASINGDEIDQHIAKLHNIDSRANLLYLTHVDSALTGELRELMALIEYIRQCQSNLKMRPKGSKTSVLDEVEHLEQNLFALVEQVYADDLSVEQVPQLRKTVKEYAKKLANCRNIVNHHSPNLENKPMWNNRIEDLQENVSDLMHELEKKKGSGRHKNLIEFQVKQAQRNHQQLEQDMFEL